jgi:hypothetical protein
MIDRIIEIAARIGMITITILFIIVLIEIFAPSLLWM